MTSELTVAQGDLLFQADFASPRFGLFGAYPTLAQELYQRIAGYGLRMADMKLEQPFGNFAEMNLACNLFSYAAAVRIWLYRLEVSCFDIKRFPSGEFAELAVRATSALRAQDPETPFKNFTFAVGLHGQVAGLKPTDFLSRFVNNPSQSTEAPSETPVGSAVLFYYGAKGSEVTSQVNLDMSGVVANAIYFRSQVVWEPLEQALEDFGEGAQQFLESSMQKVGLVASFP